MSALDSRRLGVWFSFVGVLALAASSLVTACYDLDFPPTCVAGHWGPPQSLELGVEAELLTVTGYYFDREAEWERGFIAAGAAGTVVVWNEDELGAPTVRQAKLGDGVLRDVAASRELLWVVGDAGFMATSADQGETWTQVELGQLADLHGIFPMGDWVFAVGDEALWIGDKDGEWAPAITPEGGFGQLRAATFDGFRYLVVGLDGVAWSTPHPPTGEWDAEPIGTSADLLATANASSEFLVVGRAGTVMWRSRTEPWEPRDVGSTADFVDYAHGFVLTGEGELYDLIFDELELVTTIPGARAFDFGTREQLRLVGDAGGVWALDFECDVYSE